MAPFTDVRILTLAVNLPGPLAAARLKALGASLIKVEPPEGDPLAKARPEWYRQLHQGQEIRVLDLKKETDHRELRELVQQSDLLLTALRPAALRRLGLDWDRLHEWSPQLGQVALIGNTAQQDQRPGHDLTYQAASGLLAGQTLPRGLFVDYLAAEKMVTAALELVLIQKQTHTGHYREIGLAETADQLAEPLRENLTTPGQMLGGGLPGYNLYATREGWIAVAALEPRFWQRLTSQLGLVDPSYEELEQAFAQQTARQWEEWARQHDLPLVAVASESNGHPR